jgi:hypothetical protein
MQIFLSAFEDVPDPRASNARHDLRELLVIAFVSVLCGSASCTEMAAFGRAKERLFRDFLKLKHAIPSHDTFSEIVRVTEPKALDAAFGKVLADVAALLKDGDVIAIDGKALRGAREKNESARTRMMVSAYASRLRLTLATVTADRATELDAAIEALGLIALKGTIAELCRREGIALGLYYSWSKEFLEAGKKRLAGDKARAASTSEVKDLCREARDLKEASLSKHVKRNR